MGCESYRDAIRKHAGYIAQAKKHVIHPGLEHLENLEQAVLRDLQEEEERAAESGPCDEATCDDDGDALDALEDDLPTTDVSETRRKRAAANTEAGRHRSATLPNLLPPEQHWANARRLNSGQTEIHNHVLHHMRHHSHEQLLPFITGGAGVGKSALRKVLFQTATNVSNTMIDQGDFHKPKAMVMAMTGCTARNVGGKTVHSVLGLGWGTSNEASASSRTLQEQRVQWQYVDTVFIDEISLISTDILSRINFALNNIFGTHDVAKFGGKHVIFLGDSYQLPPVTGRMIFLPPKAAASAMKKASPIDPFKAMAAAGTPLTEGFKLYELTEIMRQKDAVPFANLLARLRRGPSHLTEEDRVVLRSRTNVQPFPDDIYVSWFNKDVDE